MTDAGPACSLLAGDVDHRHVGGIHVISPDSQGRMHVSDEQVCPECQRKFKPYNKRKNVIFCSYACQMTHGQRTRREIRQSLIIKVPCLRCGTEFLPVKMQKYCSDECRVLAKATRMTHIRAVECAACGETFNATRAQQKYCSPGCRQDGHAALARVNYSPERNRRHQDSYRARNNLAVRRSRYKNWYGIDLETYEAIFAAQLGLCAICCNVLTIYDSDTHLDHKHSDDRAIRGILCARCNTGLGHFGDDPVLLRAAAIYLDAHARPTIVVPLKKGVTGQ